jgi:hypothetical protein
MSSTEILVYPASLSGLEQTEVEGKFLQLSWRHRSYLVFGAFERYRYHNQILARFAEDHGLTYRWIDARTLEVNSRELQVHGGGRFRLDPRQQRLDLWDNSQLYGRFEDAGLAQSIAGAAHPWCRLAIQVS